MRWRLDVVSGARHQLGPVVVHSVTRVDVVLGAIDSRVGGKMDDDVGPHGPQSSSDRLGFGDVKFAVAETAHLELPLGDRTAVGLEGRVSPRRCHPAEDVEQVNANLTMCARNEDTSRGVSRTCRLARAKVHDVTR